VNSYNFLIPPITCHTPQDFEKRINKIEESLPERLFENIVNLTQSDFTNFNTPKMCMKNLEVLGISEK
jgi:hypothetical protein